MRTAVEPLLLGVSEDEFEEEFEEGEEGEEEEGGKDGEGAKLHEGYSSKQHASHGSQGFGDRGSGGSGVPAGRSSAGHGGANGTSGKYPDAMQRMQEERREARREERRERRKVDAVARWAKGVGYPEAEVGWLQWKAIGSFLEQEMYNHPALVPMWGKAVRGTFKVGKAGKGEGEREGCNVEQDSVSSRCCCLTCA